MPDEVDDPGWDDVIEEAVSAHIALMSTAFAAVVLNWSATRKARIQPLNLDREVDPETDEERFVLPRPIANVPYAGQATQAGGLTFDLAPNDIVMCVTAERAIDAFLSTGAQRNEPKHPRAHDRSDAVIVGVLHSFANPLPALAFAAGAVTLFGTDVRLGDSTASDFVALASLVVSEITAQRTWAATHVHTGVTTGAGSSGQPAAPPPSVGAVAATKVKSK